MQGLKTKQQIVQEKIIDPIYDPGISMFTAVIAPAMDQYSEQMALAFAGWHLLNKITGTLEERYAKFLNTLTPKP
jgi:hypothetical protein